MKTTYQRRAQEKKLEKIDKKSITKIVSSTKKSYGRVNVSIIDNNDPLIQLNK